MSYKNDLQDNNMDLQTVLNMAKELPNAIEIVQTTGDGETVVMSQKAVTEALDGIDLKTPKNFTEAQKKQARDNIGVENVLESTGSGDTLTWDGNTEGLVNLADTFFKVSNAVPPTPDELANGATVKMSRSAGLSPEISFTEIGKGFFISTNSECVVIQESSVGIEIEGIIPQEPGVYLVNQGGIFVSSLTIPGYTGFAKKQINPEYLPEFSWENLKDKPFGVEYIPVIEQQECISFEAGGLYALQFQSGDFFSVWNIVEINLDGVSYSCEIELYQGMKVCGNKAAFGGVDSGEPFACMEMDGNLMVGLLGESEPTTHIFGLALERIEKLNQKYIPVSTFYKDGTTSWIYLDGGCTVKATMEDLRAATKNRIVISVYTEANITYLAHPIFVGIDSNYGEVVLFEKGTIDGPVFHSLYTAEYQPKT